MAAGGGGAGPDGVPGRSLAKPPPQKRGGGMYGVSVATDEHLSDVLLVRASAPPSQGFPLAPPPPGVLRF